MRERQKAVKIGAFRCESLDTMRKKIVIILVALAVELIAIIYLADKITSSQWYHDLLHNQERRK